MKSIFNKYKLLCIWLFLTISCLAQDTVLPTKISNKFFQLELGWAEANIKDPVFYDYNESKEPWFLEKGVLINFGYGFQHEKWVGVGVFTGLDWRATTKMVSVPLNGSVFLNPKISDDVSIFAQASLGKIFLIDDKIISGLYMKGKMGVVLLDNLLITIEYGNYELSNETHTEIDFVSFCVGIISF